LALVCVGSLAACSFRPGSLAFDSLADAPFADASLDGVSGWSTPSLVALPTTVANSDDDPSLTSDLLELYVNRVEAGDPEVYVSIRASADAAWPAPVPVALVSAVGFGETTPEVSYDGLALIIASNRTGTIGGNDLWLSTRNTRAEAWSDPQRIADLSSTDNEAAGNLSPDGLAVVFSSYRKGLGTPDLYYAERASKAGPWNVTELVALNTAGHEGSPCLSADKLTIYFDTDREGSGDLFMSHRASVADAFPAPTKVPDVNTADAENDPWISLDERRIVFWSNRGGEGHLWEATR